MVAPTPISWGTIEDAIVAWFEGATGLTTIWRHQSAPQPALPYASLMITGPRKIGGQDELRNETDYPVSALDVTITPLAQNSTAYTVDVNGTEFTYSSDASATVAEITAGLVVLVTAGSEPVTAVDNGTDLELTGDGGALFTLALSDDFDDEQIDYANNDEGHEVGITVSGMREITVSCQAYIGRPSSLDPTAHALHFITVAQSSLGLPATIAALSVAGLAIVEEGDATDISEITGAAFASRANMDVRFGLASNVEERVGYIQQVAISSSSTGFDWSDEIIGGS